MGKASRLVAALAMGAGLVIGLLPGVAQAAPKATVATVVDVAPRNAHSCDPGDFCAYYLRNYQGYVYAWAGSDANWSNNLLPNGHAIHNNDMSWWNRGNGCAGCDTVRVFDNTNYGAPRTVCLVRGQMIPELVGSMNKGSSHSWYGGC